MGLVELDDVWALCPDRRFGVCGIGAGEAVYALRQVAGVSGSPFADSGEEPQLLWREVLVLVDDDGREMVAVQVDHTVVGKDEREVELAVIDWRDVLMNGDLAHDDWSGVLDSELGPDRTS